jgi:transposase, IS5 family
VLRTVSDQPTLWDAILPSELLVLPAELARVDALLDDPVFFAPFAAHFDARIGRPSIPMETYLRLMFLKFRYRLGYEVLCREVADSISWQRFCRIPLGVRVPHPTTLMKISTRCGDDAVAALNEALLVKAAAGKLLRTDKVRADTTDARGEFIILSMAVKNTGNEPRSYFAENQKLFDSAVETTQRTPWRTCR